MILHVEFIHSAQVVRGRRRTPETAHYVASMAINLDSPADDEAPVVATHPRQEDRAYDRLETVVIRQFGGRLYRQETRNARGNRKAEAVSFDETQAAASDALSYERPFHLGQEYDYKFPEQGFPDGVRPGRPLRQAEDAEFVRVVSTGEPDCVGKLLEWAADRICVNGLLWTPAVEPLLVYDVSEGGFAIDENPRTDMLLGSLDHYFRLNEQESAVAHLRDVHGIVAKPLPGIEVRHPDAFQFKVDEWRLLRPARCVVPRIVGQFGPKHELLTSPDSGCAEIRAAVLKFEADLRGGGDCDAAELAAAVEKVLAGPLSRLNFPENKLIQPVLVECRQALGRWKANSDAVADDDVLGLRP